ncbi:hypothetical protein NITMOv2_1967 [Nitrospira moscoviensis]|uniref:Uncharacterized protein n=1 Tax=Nitrospira moscoviensis TaxID=42253 RepID=A0A0K2GBZ1_NITMO|nr:hypothetical protein NITMOv2_1967 [Nitrospira moscoviensis]
MYSRFDLSSFSGGTSRLPLLPNIAIGLLSMIFSRPDMCPGRPEVDGRVVGSNFLWKDDTIAGVGPSDSGLPQVLQSKTHARGKLPFPIVRG